MDAYPMVGSVKSTSSPSFAQQPYVVGTIIIPIL